ncbi:glycosyltransferase 87 family protein [Cryptosporangium minutisporangium]
MSKLRVVFGAQVLAVVAFALLWNPLDFFIYRLGGQVVGDGTRLYLEQQAAHWFTYTPFAAVTFVPLSVVPLVLARLLWALASVAAFVWVCRTVLLLAGRRPTERVLLGAAAVGLVLEPVWHSLFLGQINLLLLALVVTDLRRAALGKSAGIGIGLAAAIKLTPGIFVVLLLAAGRIRAAMVAAVTFAAGTLVGWLVAPEASLVYWRDVFYDTTRVGVPYVSNQSPYGALVRILGSREDVGAWYVLIPLTLGAAGLAAGAVYARRGDWLAALAATGLTGLLVSPISWSHHWVWALPALVVLWRDGYRRAALAAGAVFVASPMWFTRLLDWPDEIEAVRVVVANTYLLLGLGLLAHLAVAVRRSASRPDDVGTLTEEQPVGEPPLDERSLDAAAPRA